jgi:hypothetical protein
MINSGIKVSNPERSSTSISLPTSLLEKVRVIASQNRRTVSAQIQVWIEEQVEKGGAA